MRVSTWIDCGWLAIRDHADAHLAALHELGISRVCVMLNQPNDKTFGMNWKPEALYRLNQWLVEAGIALTITTWARPTKEYLDGMAEVLPELADSLGADIELDLEGQWTGTAATRAGWTLEAAERYLLGCLRPVPTGRRLCITPAYVRPQLSMARHCDEVALQCYSYHDPNDPARAWDGWGGPGHYQARGGAMLRDELPSKAHVIGLAAWAQDYPGHDPHEAMAAAWDACVEGGIPEVRYWSWAWIAGREYAYQFLKEKSRKEE